MEKEMTAAKTRANDKAAIKQLIDSFMASFSVKDVKAMLSHYAPDAIMYDVKLPFQTKGAIAWRHTWEACLPYFPDSFQVEIRDLKIHVSGDLAVAHFLFRLTGTKKDDPAAQTWIRTTGAYQRKQGKWKVIHTSMAQYPLIHIPGKPPSHLNYDCACWYTLMACPYLC
jgi:uncharacterized protein (TIGR02246 family)